MGHKSELFWRVYVDVALYRIAFELISKLAGKLVEFVIKLIALPTVLELDAQ